jgi:tetratricopeptide (TPR) repeat protein
MAAIAIPFLVSGAARRPPADSATASAAGSTPSPAREKELEAAVARNPQDLEARIELARVYLAQKNLKNAWKQTQEALRLSPGDPRALTYEGLIRVAAGQPEAAVGPLRAAIAKKPDLLEARLQLAYAYLRMNLTTEAEATIAAATERFPDKSESINQLLAKMQRQVAQERPSADGKRSEASSGEANPDMQR